MNNVTKARLNILLHVLRSKVLSSRVLKRIEKSQEIMV